jgi:hypothetical protein
MADERDVRDVIWEQCEQVADYLARLEVLVAEPDAPTGAPVRPHRPAIVPEIYGHAGRVLLTTHEGVRRLEASLRLAVTRSAGRRRGGSDGNTAAALGQIAKLATQLDERSAKRAARFLAWMIGGAQAVAGIDEARRWRHLPKAANEKLPPRCPHCGTCNLVADVEARLVACAYPGCTDANGDPPVAAMGYDEAAVPILTWADGRLDRAPSLDGMDGFAPDLEAAG